MALSEYVTVGRLVDGTRLRSMLLALRGRLRQFTPPSKPNPDFVAIMEHPFESVVDVEDRLSRLEHQLREESDRRAIFLMIYTRMTREVRRGIERGRFANPDWMRRYVLTFADYYRRAFLAFETGAMGAVPDPWRIAFGTAISGEGLVLQDALLGINAHINYDLALTLDDVGIDPNRDEKYTDHRTIDQILARLVDTQQEVLAEYYASGIDEIDAISGQMDERLSMFSIEEGREQAWRIAVVMTDADVPPLTTYARWVLRATATGGAFFVLGPRLEPSVQQALRDVESGDTDLEWMLKLLDAGFDETM
jgi:hypothetical protein